MMDLDFDLDIPGGFDEDSLLLEPLYRGLFERQCILVLGPNLATVEQGGVAQPLLHRFSLILANHLKKSGKNYDANEAENLPYIALRWLHEIKGVQSIHLRSSLKKFYTQFSQNIPNVYKILAKLPFFLVINTAPDDFMHQAFTNEGKSGNLLHYNYLRNQTPLIPQLSPEAPLVYNLFGDYRDEESLVITKEDEIEFMNNMLKNVSELPNELMKHFDKNKNYLFLGFDTQTWHLPLLLRSLMPQQETSAFYINPQEIVPMVKMFYEDSFNFNFVAKRVGEFAEELNTGYGEWRKNQKDAPPPVEQTYIDRPQIDMAKGKAKVLVMTSNPKDTEALDLNAEIKSIQSAHRQASKRDDFEIGSALDIEKMNLLKELLYHEPQIIHFSGHGTGSTGLLFYGDSGYAEAVAGEELATLFKQFTGISCVLLNACYSEDQAQIIAQYIPNVIGTDNAIGDEVALTFSEGFYQALFSGKTYENAFFMAMAHVGMASFPAGGRPVYYKDGQRVQRS